MKKQRSFTLLTITLLFVFVFSLFRPAMVLAEESTPPAPTGEPAAATEPAVTEEAVATEAVPSAVPEADPASTPEADTPAEIIESAPAGVDVVVLDENGNAMTLTTEEAAQVILAGDPMWCPENVLPGGVGCTSAYASFTDLLTELNTNPYSGNGTIYVAYDYAGAEGQITFNHNDPELSNLDDLTIQGGWDFVSNDIYDNPAYQSTLNGTWLNIANWTGDVTVNNIFIDKADGIGLDIVTQGNVNLNDVTVQYSDLEGARIRSYGDVTVKDSSFNNNGVVGYSGANLKYGADGIRIFTYADGDIITLNHVIANNNSMNGAFLSSVGGDVFVINDSQFINNGWVGESNFVEIIGPVKEMSHISGDGLYVRVDYAAGDITLSDITANDNAGDGADLFSDYGEIIVTDSVFNNNGGIGDVFISYSYSEVESGYSSLAHFSVQSTTGSGLAAILPNENDLTLTRVTANNNANNGVINYYIGGDITVTDSEFNGNGWGCGVFCDNPEALGSVFEDMLYDNVGNTDNDEFCYMTGFFTFIFNPCTDSGYINVYSPNFVYQVDAFVTNEGVIGNSYHLTQDGGSGLFLQGKDVTLDNVDANGNSYTGASVAARGETLVTGSYFAGNGLLGALEVSEGVYLNYNYFSDDDFWDDEYTFTDGYASLREYLRYEYGDGLSISSFGTGDVSLIDVVAVSNGNTGIDVYASDGSVLMQDVVSVVNGYPIAIGGEGLFGEYLYDRVGLDYVIELPISSLYLDLNVGLTGEATLDQLSVNASATSGYGVNASAGKDLTLERVITGGNLGYGASLSSGGNTNISQSGFYENGSGLDGYLRLNLNNETQEISFYLNNGSGLLAGTKGGNITLSDVESSGNILHGAELYSGGSIFVENSYFNDNGYNGVMGDGFYTFGNMYNDGINYEEEFESGYGSGLFIHTYGDGNVTLINVDANKNNMDGATVTSDGGRVIVSCGQYNTNGEYGIHEHGASSLELYGPEILDNAYSPDEYYFSGSLILSEDCTIPTVTKQGGEGNGEACIGNEANTFIMSNGDYVIFPCPIKDYAVVTPLVEGQLPAALGSGFSFLSALKTEVFRDDESVKKLSKPALISFIIPEGADTSTLAILFWNGTEWEDLGGQVSADGLYFEVSTKQVGTFVLVSK